MLQIKNLTITHRKDLRVILEDFHLTLNSGDKAVIIGEEGNGKSTLIKWIYEPDMAEEYTECTGERICTKERLGYLPQEFPDTERFKTVYEYFSQSDFFYNKTPKELSVMAKQFRVEEGFFYSDQKMGSLSGGEKMKAALMRIFMEEPTVLLLDEPSNDMDIDTLKLLEEIILSWKGIVLYISHDETLIENTANMIIHIEQIARKTKCRYTVMRVPYREYVEQRLKGFEKQKKEAINERSEKKKRDEKYRRVVQSVEHAQNVITRQNPAGKTVIEYSLDKLWTPDGSRILAQNIFLRIRGEEKICIIGSNGSGKTTLLKKISEELLQRKDIHAEYMPQNYEEILELEKTPVDFLDTTGYQEDRTKIRTYLGSLKYTASEMEHPVRELSGGQKAKVLLLKLSLSKANVLILDEPTRNFSPLSGPVIRQMLKEFRGAVISISHDRKYIDEVCDKVYRMTEAGLILERENS